MTYVASAMSKRCMGAVKDDGHIKCTATRLFRVVTIDHFVFFFFFKVQQAFVQEFSCDQSRILSFTGFQVAPTGKCSHQKIKTRSGIHSQI